MSVEFKINDREFNKFFKKMDKLSPTVLFNAKKRLIKLSNGIRNKIILSMRNTPRAEWFYKRGNKTHHPSRPFNPPAIDKGQLVARIITSVGRDKVEVGSRKGPKYDIYLEKGTRKMKKRPWLEPIYNEEKDNIKREMKNVIIESLHRELRLRG